jgi:sugar lactone lactonase YvrE
MVGESLVWSDVDQALFLVDIVGKTISSFNPVNNSLSTWQAPEIATSIGLCRDGGFIVGLERRVCRWHPGGAFETAAVPEPDLPGNRLNEGAVAPDGSFWVGTMQTNLMPDGTPRQQTENAGAYYRISPSMEVSRLTANEYGITNTMAWLPDGRFVTADTTANTLYAFRQVPGGGLTDRTVFNAGFERGLPDGSAMDTEGFLWNCRVAGGACLARMAPDGRVDRVVDLPCTWPTSCAFGGPDLATLYVSSARFGMDSQHLTANPQEGALFALDVGARGTAANLFG